ncbi:DNA-binding response regulator, partial [Candidatus Sumerlaeota bacterium]|nr:DNA-binding response regulator [Candidatus Sumerlaeota bacterium]
MSAKILIVEDNDSIRTILRMTLELGQYQVIEACDGQEG